MNSQAGQGGSAPIAQGTGYGQGGGQFGPAGQDSQSAQTPYRAEPDHRGDYENQDARSGAQPDSGGEGSYAQQDYSPAAQRSKLHQDQDYTGLGANPPLAAADGHAGDGPHDPTAPKARNQDKPTNR